jgi:2-isopropylmalate synthase
MRRILVFDTTLRDGEQAPGFSMRPQEKFLMARQLEELGVDVVEAGFPAASKDDFEAVDLIAREVRGVGVAAIARARTKDIDTASKALRKAARGRINIFISTSDIHLHRQLKKSREEILDQARSAVTYARKYTDDVELSAMDATRSDRVFLGQVFETAIRAGARTVSVADTVGYAIPEEFGKLVRHLLMSVKGIEATVLSVHCHNDLGLAVANSLAAIQNGAGQVKCTINGIGERAGNASLEEIVMALETRKDLFRCVTCVVPSRLLESSRLLTRITGVAVQPNKAIVGHNAFTHSSPIHRDGLTGKRSTYEVFDPVSIGAEKRRTVPGRCSGRPRKDSPFYRESNDERDLKLISAATTPRTAPPFRTGTDAVKQKSLVAAER